MGEGRRGPHVVVLEETALAAGGYVEPVAMAEEAVIVTVRHIDRVRAQAVPEGEAA